MIILVADNKPPGQNPTKIQYMIKDLLRLSEYYKVPLQQMAVSDLPYFHTNCWNTAVR